MIINTYSRLSKVALINNPEGSMSVFVHSMEVTGQNFKSWRIGSAAVDSVANYGSGCCVIASGGIITSPSSSPSSSPSQPSS